MRAKEMPQLVFAKIAAIVRADISRMIVDGKEFEIMLLPGHEVVIASGCGKEKENVFSFFNVWRFAFRPNLVPEDFGRLFCVDPDFQIIGGPFPGALWTKKSGHRFNETVKMRFGYDLYNKGLALDDSFLLLMQGIIKIASKLMGQHKPKKLRYWEAFANPAFFPVKR